MSLDPTFASSLFGLGFISEIGALALSVATLALIFSSAPDPEALRQLARLLLAFVILWSYLALMQLIIVWQSDLPHEVAWYLPRWRQGWRRHRRAYRPYAFRCALLHTAFGQSATFAKGRGICRGVDHRRRHSSSVLAGRSGGRRSFRGDRTAYAFSLAGHGLHVGAGALG